MRSPSTVTLTVATVLLLGGLAPLALCAGSNDCSRCPDGTAGHETMDHHGMAGAADSAGAMGESMDDAVLDGSGPCPGHAPPTVPAPSLDCCEDGGTPLAPGTTDRAPDAGDGVTVLVGAGTVAPSSADGARGSAAPPPARAGTTPLYILLVTLLI